MRRGIFLALILAAWATSTFAQISVEEAQKRLEAREAARAAAATQAATQPTTKPFVAAPRPKIFLIRANAPANVQDYWKRAMAAKPGMVADARKQLQDVSQRPIGASGGGDVRVGQPGGTVIVHSDPTGFATAEEKQVAVKRARDHLKAISAVDSLPTVPMKNLAAGEIGGLDGIPLAHSFSYTPIISVIQIIDDSTMLAFLETETSSLDDSPVSNTAVELVGFSTKGFTTGSQVDLSDTTLVASGTYTYQTASGAQRTVLVLKAFDITPYLIE